MIDYALSIIKSKSFLSLKDEFEKGDFLHAYLFIGEDESYINSFATYITQCIMCDIVPVCHTCPACIKVEKNIHPDVFMLNAKTRTVKVEDITEVLESLYVMPYEGDRKVYVIYNAEQLSEVVQNKLLKTIEEPPKNVIILLTATNENKLLRTIVSRCRKVYVSPIGNDDIKTELVKLGTDEKTANIISAMSGGNITQAKSLALNSSLVKNFETALDMLAGMNSSRDILSYFAKIDNEKESVKEFINAIILILRDVLMCKNGCTNLVLNKMYLGKIEELADKFSNEAITKIIKKALLSLENLEYNMNITMCLDSLLISIVEVKVKCRK